MNLSILCSALCLGLLAIETSCFDKEKLQEMVRKEVGLRDKQQSSQIAEDAALDGSLVKRASTGCENNDAGHFNNIGRALDGYDIMYGYPNSGDTSLDPGIKYPVFHADYTENSYTPDCQFRIPNGLLGYMATTCRLDFSSEEVRNSQEHSEALSAGAEVSGGGWGVAFSASANYAEEQESLESGESVFIFSQASCTYYFSRLNKQAPPQLNSLFVAAVKNLISKSSDTSQYYNFISKYGTHVPEEVTFGARYIKKYEMSSADYMTFQSNNVDVAVEASYSGFVEVSASVSVSTAEQERAQEFQSKTTSTTVTIGSTPPASGQAEDWASTTKASPVPIKYKLMEISELFTGIYFSGHSDISEADLASIKIGMESALDGYCEYLKGEGRVTTCVPRVDLPLSLQQQLPVNLEEVDGTLVIQQGLSVLHAVEIVLIQGNERRPATPAQVVSQLSVVGTSEHGGVNWNDCTTVSQYTWGKSLDCPMGYVAVGACSSGENRDCGGQSHKLKCCRETYPAGGISQCRGCRTKESTYGHSIQCESNENILSLCGSGQGKDCGVGVANRITCCDSSITTTSTCRWINGDWHAMLSCNSGEVMTGFCGSGENKDCGGYSHKIRCCTIVT